MAIARWLSYGMTAGLIVCLGACSHGESISRTKDSGTGGEVGWPGDALRAAADVPADAAMAQLGDSALDDALGDWPAHETTIELFAAIEVGLLEREAGGEPSVDVAVLDLSVLDSGTVDADGGPCPLLMVPINGAFCIDAYEAALEEQSQSGNWAPASPYETVGTRVVRAVPAKGAVPQGYISGNEAELACERADKRLCTSAEWLLACRGPNNVVYPYGNSHVVGACNDVYPGTNPVADYFGSATGVWDPTHLNDPGINTMATTVAKGGEFSRCQSAWGVFDLHGNLQEWVADVGGTLRGGYYADGKLNGAGCNYVSTSHANAYHDYSTGFRCCSNVRGI